MKYWIHVRVGTRETVYQREAKNARLAKQQVFEELTKKHGAYAEVKILSARKV